MTSLIRYMFVLMAIPPLLSLSAHKISGVVRLNGWPLFARNTWMMLEPPIFVDGYGEVVLTRKMGSFGGAGMEFRSWMIFRDYHLSDEVSFQSALMLEPRSERALEYIQGSVWHPDRLMKIATSKTQWFVFAVCSDPLQLSIPEGNVPNDQKSNGEELDSPVFRYPSTFRGKQSPKIVLFRQTVQSISGATICAHPFTTGVHPLWCLNPFMGHD